MPSKDSPLASKTEIRSGREPFEFASSFPFGGAARVCIGERFAWMEGVLVLVAVAQKWKLRLDPHQRVEPLPLITLRTQYGMRMSAVCRSVAEVKSTAP